MHNSSEDTDNTALRTRVKRIIESGMEAEPLLQLVCDVLQDSMENCDWAGYYLVDPMSPGQLFLGPFTGEPTEHTRIGFGEGICGQAAYTEKTFIITDVSRESNYLSCNPEVKSEIVVPIFLEGRVIGEIDLDSHRENGFSEDDRTLLEWLAGITSELTDKVRRGAGIN
jgi:L-methionine (R)-S-oxide reductase